MKKYWRISLLLFLVVMVACQQQLQFEEDLLKQEALISKEGIEINPTSLSKQSTLKENGLPELTFKTNENGKAILILKDDALTGSDLPDTGKITLTYKSKLTHLIQDSFAPGHAVRMRLPDLPAGGSILQADIQYFKADGSLRKSYLYDVFVFEDGTTGLQKPIVKFKKAEMYAEDIRFNYSSAATFGMVVENDPAGIVTAVQVRFNEPFGGPAPSTTTYLADCGTCQPRDTFQDRSYIFDVKFAPDQNPLGSSYSITAAMLNAKGETVGESITTEVVLQKADFTGRIRKVRIRESGEGSNEYRAIVVVENASPLEVAKTEIVYNEPFAGPKPLLNRWDGDYKDGKEPGEWTSGNQISRYTAVGQFSGDPTGFTYNVTATMLDVNGKTIGQPVTMDVVVEAAPFKGISKVAIKESDPGSGKFLIGALVEHVNENRLDYVEVKFTEPFNGPKPNLTSFRMRKRPDLLFQEWDNLIDEHSTEIQSNPLFVSNEPEINPLFFEKSAVGSTYSIIMTTYSTNGKPIGEPQSFEVTVEGTATTDDEPVVLSSTLTTKDNGLTWDITVTIDDKGQWVEKVVYEFVKPYAGPAPLVNPITLVRTGETSGTIEVYSASGIKFEKNPEGFTYEALIYYSGGGIQRGNSARLYSKAGT